jgi:hypothetical protein
MDPETEFFTGLLELQYGQDVVGKLKNLSEKISWAEGWPGNKKSFWNAEAFMWEHKIEKEKRELIKKELSYLQGKNLDLGCGTYSYIPSIGVDISEKMLQFNENCTEKIIVDLEEKLPFENNSFDSVTAVFFLNYVENDFVMVLSAKDLNSWQKQKQINDFGKEKWVEILVNLNFKVESYEKEGILFFRVKVPTKQQNI